MIVLATAGHVDHGKSTFLKALSGMEPDRLKEEKKRGMTLDLNFVWWKRSNGEKVGIVDVPGHKRLIKNMISGTMQVDGAFLLIAADDGWMPQTEEHWQILKGLDIKNGLVVLSKIDLVSAEDREKLKKEFLERTSWPVIEFSSLDGVTKEGVDLIENLLNTIPLKKGNSPRLWIDRSFTPQGEGVVVTGTLEKGILKQGQEIELWPKSLKANIRKLQSYQEKYLEVQATARVAVQLTKVNHSDVTRGVLLYTGNINLTQQVDVCLNDSIVLKRNTEVSFHIGTLQEKALLVKIDERHFRVKFKRPIPLSFLDRFILRTSGEEKLLSSGVVLDASEKLMKLKDAKLQLPGLKQTLLAFVQYEINKTSFVNLNNLLKKSNFDLIEIQSELQKKYKEVIVPYWCKFEDEIRFKELLKDSLRNGLNESELYLLIKAQFKVSSVDFSNLLAGLEKQKFIKCKSGIVSLAVTELSPDENKILNIFKDKTEPSNLEGFLAIPNLSDGLKKLVRENLILPLGEDYYLELNSYLKLKDLISSVLKEKGFSTTSDLKAAMGFSRKKAVLVLERMDRDRLTYLKEGVRRLLKS